MDKLILYFAPKIIGGRLAPSFVEGLVLLKCKMQLNLRIYHLPRLEKIIDLLVIQNIGKMRNKENKNYLYVPIDGLQNGAMKSEVWI